MHNWLFICFLLSLPILLILSFILWRTFRQKSQNGNIPGDNDNMEGDEEDDDDVNGERQHRNILKNDQSPANSDQPPEKIPRKGTLRKNIDWSKPVGASALQDNFLSEFDKREAIRKARQEENDEKLKDLLNWRSPYELYDGTDRKIKKHKQPLKTASLSSRKEKDEGEKQTKSKTGDKLVEKEWEKTGAHGTSTRRRHSNTPDLLQNLKGPGVSKIINFVAIKSQPSEPEYKPRNKIKTKIEELPPRPTPRGKRKPKPPKRLYCPVINQHHFDDEVIEDETLGSLDEFDVVDESHANVKVNEHFHEASTTLVETNFNLERTPPTRRSLEFSDYKRNFLTDRLFAGNIYVGSQASDSEQKETENGTNMVTRDNNNFTSWKDSFNRKMSS